MEFKRRITPTQLTELTPKQQEKLREWWKPKEGDFYCDKGKIQIVQLIDLKAYHYMDIEESPEFEWLPLLDISQMIELIMENDPYLSAEYWGIEYTGRVSKEWSIAVMYREHKNECLCDAFWQEVKEILAKEAD